MKKRLVANFVSAVGAIAALGASGASAATEFGSNCVAEGALHPGFTAVQLSTGSSPLPAAAPISGVITKWQVNVVPGVSPESLQQRLKVLRPTGAPKTFTVVGNSDPATLRGGANVFFTRLPVAAGDRLGMDGDTAQNIGALLCPTNHSGDRMGFLPGNGAVGSLGIASLEQEEALLAGSAVIEPDTDGDGYGDETQDRCLVSALSHVECPVVSVSSGSERKKNAVIVTVTVSDQATVAVTGTAKLGKGRTAKLAGGSQTLAAGSTGSFRLAFTKPLRKRLGKLAPKKSLNLLATATVTDSIGRVTTPVLKVKLKGRARRR